MSIEAYRLNDGLEVTFTKALAFANGKTVLKEIRRKSRHESNIVVIFTDNTGLIVQTYKESTRFWTVKVAQ
jgi:hypothetical protein